MAKININNLEGIILESVRGHLAEQKLRRKVNRIIRESLYNMGNQYQYESDNEEDGRLSDANTEDKDQQERRSQIEDFFHKRGVDHAPYAYQLYGISPEEGKDTDEMKNARSKFEKCLNHEKNEGGYPYNFTSSEINRLHSMISSNQLEESINSSIEKAMKKVLREGIEDEMTIEDALNLLQEAYDIADDVFNRAPGGMRMDLASVTGNIRNAIRIIKAKQKYMR